ncbi:hypothetical protein ACFP3Q_10560 [Nocardioides sp. GCM10027113]|uniref:hypothetical protein n=1 Tax=unclassified Nocardioides TaxID=2615069 RepID=UPI0036240B58
MITDEDRAKVAGWFAGRLPQEWQASAPEVTIDRDEITVMLVLPDVEHGEDDPDAVVEEKRAGRASGIREDTRAQRMEVAREGQHRYGRKVSWGVVLGDRRELWTHVSAPVMTRLKQPQRRVLDTLVEAGVARSRSEALAWCVRLVGQHEEDWLAELRDAMTAVDDVRRRGPAA